LNNLPAQGFKPVFEKRGGLRSLFDGKYEFTRYFSPQQHNQPKTLEGMSGLNDVERSAVNQSLLRNLNLLKLLE
jgi:arylsulfatase